MSSAETDFADIPDPVADGPPRAVREVAVAAPSEPSPTRAQVAMRRALAIVIGVAGAIGIAVMTGPRDDLLSAEVLAQIGLWAVALPVSLALALRPRSGGFPAGVTAVRIGLVALVGLFIALALIPMQGLEVALTPRSVRFCIKYGALAGLPGLVGAALVLRHAFLNAPILRGALVGAVCGLAGAISIHSHCPIVSSSHIVVAHGLPIVAFGALGAIFGAFRGRV